MTSANVSDFLTPSPLTTVTNQLILFLSSAFWGSPYPHRLRKPPFACQLFGALWDFLRFRCCFRSQKPHLSPPDNGLADDEQGSLLRHWPDNSAS